MRAFMLDSGAFSAWNKGVEVNFDAYIQFCVEHPTVTAYVNLDVIPGKPNDVRSLKAAAIEDASQRGWDNYQKMLEKLPIEKVIPVYHQNDDIKWLKRYLSFGTPYIGISPANDRTTNQRLIWLNGLKSLLFHADGRPRVKTHGFAVTSFKLMKFWQWHSVDSASWSLLAAYGQIIVPVKRQGVWDYTAKPHIIFVSPKHKHIKEFGMHYLNLTPMVRAEIDEYLEMMGVKIGAYEIRTEPTTYKLQEGESWIGKKGTVGRTEVLKAMVSGVMTCQNTRRLINAQFFQAANEVLPVDYLYQAGTCYGISNRFFPCGASVFQAAMAAEKAIKYRLMSFAYLNDGRHMMMLDKHLAAGQKELAKAG